MNDKIAITEGTRGRYFSPVDKLKINNVSTGSSYWVLEETSEVDSLDVTKNGQYYAVNDDLDGYDQVNVNVSPELDANDLAKGKKITGKDQDGNDYEYGKDEEGNLTTEMVPAAIHIVVPPRKLKYEDGEVIDFTGIHVYLMDGNNRRYVDDSYPTGEIPFSELIFPVTVASSEGIEWETAHSDLLDGSVQVGQLTPVIDNSGATGKWAYYPAYCENIDGWYRRDSRNVIYLFVSSVETERIRRDVSVTFGRDILEYSYSDSTIRLTANYTYGGKTVYYYYGLDGQGLPSISYGTKIGDEVNDFPILGDVEVSKAAWTLLYGDVIGGDIEIPVQWMRSDGVTLEDTFTIEVGEGGEPSPEPESDPWAGYADVSLGGHHYNINRRIVPAVHYANGYCWQEGTSEYTVEQAASMGWLILIR